jgi:Aspartyl protease
MVSTKVPMPTPRSSKAPRFNGTRVVEFCDDLEMHASNAGLPDADIPSYVSRYCSSKVKQVIEHCDELAGNDWTVCRTFLIDLYESSDRAPRASADRLRAWVKIAEKAPAFVRREDVDKYHREFLARSSQLVKKKLIVQTELDMRFYKGLPKEIKKKIRVKIPDDKTNSNPPNIATVLKHVRALFDDDDLDAETDLDEDLDLELSSSESDTDSDSDSDVRKRRRSHKKLKKKKSVRFETQDVPGAPPIEPATPKKDPIDQLAEDMKKLQLSQAQLLNRLAVSGPSGRGMLMSPSDNRLCWVCDGDHTVHRIGLRNCPVVPRLISEGLVQYNQVGRLTRTDGSDLPRVSPGSGGIARAMREEASRSSRGKDRERDTPPHLSTSMSIELLQDGKSLIEGDVFAVVANDGWADNQAAARSQRPDNRNDPYKRPDRLPPKPSVVIPIVPKKPANKENPFLKVTPDQLPRPSFPKAPEPFKTPVLDAPLTTKAPVHPANTEDQWRAKRTQPRAPINRDVEMKDPSRPEAQKSANKYHFTSDIQESVKVDSVQEKVLSTMITMPLREVLAISADLQKRFTNLTKIRREYVSDSTGKANLGVLDDEEEDIRPGQAMLSYDDQDDVASIANRYVGAVAVSPNRFFAMTTGRFEGKFADTPVSFMIDSGSELNLIPEEIYNQTRVALDVDGSRWSLRGVHGAAVPLKGCCRDVPITIGGHRFDHHFFVNTGSGKQDIILGQPWLTWFSAQANYTREGKMDLALWSNGDRTGPPTISIPLCSPDAPRNQDKLVVMRSRVAEVTDDEQDF